jgi:hypothetical protein
VEILAALQALGYTFGGLYLNYAADLIVRTVRGGSSIARSSPHGTSLENPLRPRPRRASRPSPSDGDRSESIGVIRILARGTRRVADDVLERFCCGSGNIVDGPALAREAGRATRLGERRPGDGDR